MKRKLVLGIAIFAIVVVATISSMVSPLLLARTDPQLPTTIVEPSTWKLTLNSGESASKTFLVRIGSGYADKVKVCVTGKSASSIKLPKELKDLKFDIGATINWVSISPSEFFDVTGPANLNITVTITVPEYAPSGTYGMEIQACCYRSEEWKYSPEREHPLKVEFRILQGLAEKYVIVPKGRFGRGKR